MCTRHQVDEWQIVQRSDEVNVLLVTEDASHRLLNVRVEVYRIDDLYVRMDRGDLFEGGADPLEPASEALAPVAGDKNQASFVVEIGEMVGEGASLGGIGLDQVMYPEQGIYDGVSRYRDPFVRNPLAKQVGSRSLRRCEVKTSDAAS